MIFKCRYCGIRRFLRSVRDRCEEMHVTVHKEQAALARESVLQWFQSAPISFKPHRPAENDSNVFDPTAYPSPLNTFNISQNTSRHDHDCSRSDSSTNDSVNSGCDNGD